MTRMEFETELSKMTADELYTTLSWKQCKALTLKIIESCLIDTELKFVAKIRYYSKLGFYANLISEGLQTREKEGY